MTRLLLRVVVSLASTWAAFALARVLPSWSWLGLGLVLTAWLLLLWGAALLPWLWRLLRDGRASATANSTANADSRTVVMVQTVVNTSDGVTSTSRRVSNDAGTLGNETESIYLPGFGRLIDIDERDGLSTTDGPVRPKQLGRGSGGFGRSFLPDRAHSLPGSDVRRDAPRLTDVDRDS